MKTALAAQKPRLAAANFPELDGEPQFALRAILSDNMMLDNITKPRNHKPRGDGSGSLPIPPAIGIPSS